MKDVNPISEKSQKSIVETIEKFMPDKDKSLPATELISHFVGALGEEAEDNAIIAHLAQNNEKSFNSDQLKVLAGKFGVSEYKSQFDASLEVKAEPVKESSEPKSNRNEAERINEFMNGPSEPRKLTLEDKINALDPKMKVIFKNLKERWLKDNKDLLKGVDPKTAEQMGNQFVYDSLMEAKKRANDNPAQDMSQGQGQGQSSQMNGGGSDITFALQALGKSAFGILSRVTEGVLGTAINGTKGIINGSKNAIDNAKHEASSSVENTATMEPETFEDSVVKGSRDNLDKALKGLDDKVSKLKEKREIDEWGSKGEMLETNEMLNGIDKSVDEIKDLKDVLNGDLKRKGVNKENKLEGIKDLFKAKDAMKKLDNDLAYSPKENEIRNKADSIQKAIDRIIKALKNLFSKKKDAPELAADDANTFTP